MSYEDDENKKKMEIIFAPGCFDEFDGTQEELDALIQEIRDMAESGQLIEMSIPLFDDDGDLIDNANPAEIEEIVNQMTSPRKLQ